MGIGHGWKFAIWSIKQEFKSRVGKFRKAVISHFVQGDLLHTW